MNKIFNTKYNYNKNKFLEPNNSKLPRSYIIPFNTPSSERAMSIGGEQGEPAYLIPSFKYGKPLNNPIEEYINTGEHLGGPFKTWQEAELWEKEVRHPYTEKNMKIPIPLKRSSYATGGQLTKSINKSFYPTNYSVPMLGFGDFLKDTGMLWGDFMLSQFGGQNLIQDDAYNSNFFKKASKVVEPIGQIGGQIAGNIIAPGIGGQVMGGVQQGVSSAVPMDNSGNAATNLNMVEQQKKQMLMNDYVFEDGGMLPSYNGSKLIQPDNVTVYAEGGSHETNPNGGIPLGNKALVEQNEVRYNSKKYGDYIFSARF